MENFETDFEGGSCFEDIMLAFSEDNNEANPEVSEVNVGVEMPSAEEMVETLGKAFEDFGMNEHIATVDLLGDLGYTDMLIYYCVVMDSMFFKSEGDNNEKQTEIIKPDEYIKEKDEITNRIFEFNIETSREKFEKLMKVLNYLKNKEFRILSNTFYMDGSDFVMFLSLKSVVGYNLRVKIVFKCSSQDEAFRLNEKFNNMKQIAGGDDSE